MKKKILENEIASPARAQKKKSAEFTRKIKPLRGGLVREMVRCGRANCKCVNGSLHGPYYYRVWMVRGIRHKTYVKKADLERIKAGIEAFQAHRRKQQQSAEELKAMLQELREASRNVYAILRLRGFKL